MTVTRFTESDLGEPCFEVEGCRWNWTPKMLERIEPKRTYQFGDKVKVERAKEPYYFMSKANEFCILLMVDDEYPDLGTHLSDNARNGFDTFMCLAEEVTPWPEPVRMFLDCLPNGTVTSIVDDEGVSIGRRKISFEAFDKLATEVAKARGNV